ncbi:MAG: cytochrome C oxidase subunit II [Euryarchaeota archaeon]|nr:cytochrome C oxidase subunit II [Euryarchaeota archaeon]
MSVTPPEGVWWNQKVPKEEKLWVTIALVWAIVMFVMMPLWHIYGKQNPSTETYKVAPEEFVRLTQEFIEKYKVGEENGVPVVEPPPGGDVYLLGKQFSWEPVIKLKKGETYRLHISSADVLHGFSVYPMNINFMVIPGYDYVLTVTPTQAGVYSVVCNEYCGPGHQVMVGKIIVVE